MVGATIQPVLPQLEKQFADLPYVATLVGLLLTIPAAAIALTAPVADRFLRETTS
jgi:cyanate permease